MQESTEKKLLRQLEENKLVLLGEVFEKKGRNPFLEEESWRVSAISVDNTGRDWYKLTLVQDERNSITILEDELWENFVKVESILMK